MWCKLKKYGDSQELHRATNGTCRKLFFLTLLYSRVVEYGSSLEHLTPIFTIRISFSELHSTPALLAKYLSTYSTVYRRNTNRQTDISIPGGSTKWHTHVISLRYSVLREVRTYPTYPWRPRGPHEPNIQHVQATRARAPHTCIFYTYEYLATQSQNLTPATAANTSVDFPFAINQ